MQGTEKCTMEHKPKKAACKKYLRPASASMAEFSSRTALGVSPAMKKKETYVVSVLF
jgi:hypothetical protein